jgi:hypothetical protein
VESQTQPSSEPRIPGRGIPQRRDMGWSLTVNRRQVSEEPEQLGPVKTAELDHDIADEIKKVMAETDFLTLPARMGSPATGDAYEYRLTVEDLTPPLPNERRIMSNSVFLGTRETTTAPPGVFALIDVLERGSDMGYVPISQVETDR